MACVCDAVTDRIVVSCRPLLTMQNNTETSWINNTFLVNVSSEKTYASSSHRDRRPLRRRRRDVNRQTKNRTNFSVFRINLFATGDTNKSPVRRQWHTGIPSPSEKFSIGLHMCGRNNNWIVCSWNARQRSNERHRSVYRSVFVRDIGMMHGTHIDYYSFAGQFECFMRSIRW